MLHLWSHLSYPQCRISALLPVVKLCVDQWFRPIQVLPFQEGTDTLCSTLPFVGHWALQRTDAHNKFPLLETCELQSCTCRDVHLNIWLELFWSICSWARGRNLAHVQACGMGSDYSGCVASERWVIMFFPGKYWKTWALFEYLFRLNPHSLLTYYHLLHEGQAPRLLHS